MQCYIILSYPWLTESNLSIPMRQRLGCLHLTLLRSYHSCDIGGFTKYDDDNDDDHIISYYIISYILHLLIILKQDLIWTHGPFLLVLFINFQKYHSILEFLTNIIIQKQIHKLLIGCNRFVGFLIYHLVIQFYFFDHLLTCFIFFELQENKERLELLKITISQALNCKSFLKHTKGGYYKNYKHLNCESFQICFQMNQFTYQLTLLNMDQYILLKLYLLNPLSLYT